MGAKDILKGIGRGINCIIPKRKFKIMFESNSDYCDNSRAVYDYMQSHLIYQKYQYVWCVKNPKDFCISNMHNTKVTSFHLKKCFLSYLYHLFTSKTVIYTHFIPPFCNKNVQTVVNLWHGTPLKSIRGHCHSANLFNLLLSPSRFCDGLIADSFEISKEEMPKKLLRCGYPRNDILLTSGDILYKLQINKTEFRQVILWMPTFRKPQGSAYQDGESTATGLPLIDDSGKLFSLNEHLKARNLFLIIKLHPGQDLSNVTLSDFSNIKMLTNENLLENDIQPYELVSNSDVLLTDYSSIYFDYLLLDRPIGFVIDDFDTYDKNRGFTVENPLDHMPGEKIKTQADLYNFLSDISSGIDGFKNERAKMSILFNKFTDANNTKRLIEYLKFS